MNELIDVVEASYKRSDIPEFRAGDTINVHIRIREGDKERTQQFKGLVLQISGRGLSKTITVRKISSGIGVERIWPVHSPNIEKIEVVKRGRVRQSRIFYMRKRFGKAARIPERKNYTLPRKGRFSDNPREEAAKAKQ
jgi:large subunit ribosomal protein L19